MKQLLFLLLPCCAMAQIEAPRLGVFIDQHNGLRPLFGLPGALLPGPVAAEGVVSAAASRSHIVWKTADQICIQENDHPATCDSAPPASALIAFDTAGRPAVIEFESDPPVIAVSFNYRIENRDGVLVRVAYSDRSEMPLPGLSAPAFVQADGSVIAMGGESLVLRTPAGEDRTLLDRKVTRIEPLNDGLILLDRASVLRLRDGTVFRLPHQEDEP